MPKHEPLASPLQAAAEARFKGHHAHAIALLDEFLARDPNHVDALVLRAGVASDLGEGAAADRFLSMALALQPENKDLLVFAGDSALANNSTSRALARYEKALSVDSQSAAAWNGVGACHRRMGNLPAARSAYTKAMQLDSSNPVAPSALGMMAAEQRELGEAREYFTQAVAAAPQLPQSHFNLANVLSELDDLGQSVTHYQRALEIAPDYVDAWVNLALVQETQGEFDDAIESLIKALTLFPEHKRAWYLKANLLEQQSKLDEADAALERGFALAPDNPHFHLVKARLERRTGNAAAAQQRLRGLQPELIPNTLRGAVQTELGRACDAMGQSAEAFAAYAEANRLSEQSWKAENPGPNEFSERLGAVEAWLSSGVLDHWPAAIPDQDQAPVFLIGFPRSGTTLLDRILRSHGDFCVMEENSALGHLTRVIHDRFGGYPGQTTRLAETTCSQLRENYLRNAQRLASPGAHQILVDKLPLNTIHVGLIHRLFPCAKLVFALRHPLDVVLSCFMQAFEPNAAMANFFTLEQASATYVRVLNIWSRYEQALPLAVHYIRYEDVVADFDHTIGALTTFLGRTYRSEMADYYKLRGSPIKTPSYHQVSRPIYADSRYRWRRYVPYLNSSAELLAPYMRRFGYDLP